MSGSVFRSEFSPKGCGAIPESLDDTGVFDRIFRRHLKSVENAGVKTTDMGSMSRLSYKIRMKDGNEEKASAASELRVKNDNLEIALLPLTEVRKHL